MTSPKLLCLAAVAALFACAAPKPVPSQFASAAEHPKYPRARFLTAVGLSQVSAEDAALRAKANVAASVQSELKAETTSFLSSSNANGKLDEKQTASETIRLSTQFEQANLIQVVDRFDGDGTFYALAALDRAQADREIGRAQQVNVVSFTQYATTALEARASGRAGDFASALGKAEKLLPSVDAGFIVRRAVLGRPSGDEGEFLEKRNALLREKARALSQRVVQVRLEGKADGNLLTLAVNAVRKLGLRVGQNQSCSEVSANAADATELVVKPEETCSEGSLGERCEVTLQLSAQGCSGGGVGQGRTPLMRGVHPSDRNRAREAAWKRITDQTMESAVTDALKGALGD